MQCRKDLFELDDGVLYLASCSRYPLMKSTRLACCAEVKRKARRPWDINYSAQRESLRSLVAQTLFGAPVDAVAFYPCVSHAVRGPLDGLATRGINRWSRRQRWRCRRLLGTGARPASGCASWCGMTLRCSRGMGVLLASRVTTSAEPDLAGPTRVSRCTAGGALTGAGGGAARATRCRGGCGSADSVLLGHGHCAQPGARDGVVRTARRGARA